MESVVTEKAFKYFQSGLNCAESVLRAVIETVDENAGQRLNRLATPFGGGVGGSREELCGALTGGVMAIGYFKGREQPSADAGPSKALAALLRNRFMAEVKCTQCQCILDKMGPQNNSDQCARLVADTTGWVMELLQ